MISLFETPSIVKFEANIRTKDKKRRTKRKYILLRDVEQRPPPKMGGHRISNLYGFPSDRER